MRWLELLAVLLLFAAATHGLASSLRVSADNTGRRVVRAAFGVLCAAGALALLVPVIPAFGMEPRREWTGVAFAAVGAALVCLLLWRGARPWMFAPLLLFFGLPQFRSSFYTLFHSFLHYSITWQMYLRPLPPENPLMAGEPLRYMYGVHLAVAWLMRVLPVSPPVAFAALDAVGLFVFAWLAARIARRIHPDPRYRVLTVIVALFNLDAFVDGPLYGFIGELAGYRRFGAPVTLQKFTGINTNQVGLICMAMAVLAIVRLAQREPTRLRTWLLFAAGAAGAGVFYQPAFMAIGAVGGTLAVAALLFRRADYGRDAWTMLAVLAGSTAVAAPVMLTVSSGTSHDPAIQILPGWRQLKDNLKYLLIHLSLGAVLAWLARERVLRLWRERSPVLMALLLSMVVLQVLYLAVFLRFNNEYKLLGFASVAMAPLGAFLVLDLLERHRRLFPWLLLLIFMPAMTDFTWVTIRQPLTDPVTSDGRRIHHTDANEEALYDWVWRETPANAVFVDSLLTIPAISGRQLYVGLDLGRDPAVAAGRAHNGWLIDAGVFQRRIMEVDPARLALRERIATAMLAGQGALDAALLAELRASAPAGRPLYVVARGASQMARLDGHPQLERVYTGQQRNVYRLHD
jgi:hypothetical protein